MRFFLLSIVFFIVSIPSYSQSDTTKAVVKADSVLAADTVKYWSRTGNFRLNFRNVTLKNWNAGGSSNIAVGGELRLGAIKEKNDVTWTNDLLFAYGLIRESSSDFPFKKNDDRILINSRYSHKINDTWSLSSILNFRTQFDDGYRYRRDANADRETRTFLSTFMAPGYLQGSLGLTLKKVNWYSVTMAPYTGKLTFVWNDSLSQAGAFGVEKGEKSRLEAGSSITTTLKKTLFENVKVTSLLNLFAGYESFEKVDVNWEALLEMKVNKFITSSVSVVLIYDEDIDVKRDDGTIGAAVQFQNVINIGFSLDLNGNGK